MQVVRQFDLPQDLVVPGTKSTKQQLHIELEVNKGLVNEVVVKLPIGLATASEMGNAQHTFSRQSCVCSLIISLDRCACPRNAFRRQMEVLKTAQLVSFFIANSQARQILRPHSSSRIHFRLCLCYDKGMLNFKCIVLSTGASN